MPAPSISDVIAIVALIVSAWALIVTSRFNKQQLKLMKSQDALAKRQLEMGATQDSLSRRANLNAELVKLDERRWRVIVSNGGLAAARNVQVAEVEEGDLLVTNDARSKLPYELLEPGGQFQLLASVHLGSKPKVMLRLGWEDEAGSDHEKIVPVST